MPMWKVPPSVREHLPLLVFGCVRLLSAAVGWMWTVVKTDRRTAESWFNLYCCSMGMQDVVLTHHEWVSSQLRPFEALGSTADFLDQRVFHDVHEEPQQDLSYCLFVLFLSHLPQTQWQALRQRMKMPDAEDELASQEGLARLSWRVVRAVVQMIHRLLVPAAEALLKAEESARTLVAKQRARKGAMGGRLGEEEEKQNYLVWIGHMRRRYKFLSRELGERRSESCSQEQQQRGFDFTEESLSHSLRASNPISAELVHRLHLGLSVLAHQPPDPEDRDHKGRWSQISSVAVKCLAYVGDALADEILVETGSPSVEDMVGPLTHKVLALVLRSWESCHQEGEGRASLRVLKSLGTEVSHLLATSKVEEPVVRHNPLERTERRVPVPVSLRDTGSSRYPTSPRDPGCSRYPTSPSDPDYPRDHTSPTDPSSVRYPTRPRGPKGQRDAGSSRDPGNVSISGRICKMRPDSSSDASTIHQAYQSSGSGQEESDEEEEESTQEEESDGEDKETEAVTEESDEESLKDHSDEHLTDEEECVEEHSSLESHEDESDNEDCIEEEEGSEDVESGAKDERYDREKLEKMRAEMDHLGNRVPKCITSSLPPPSVLPHHIQSTRAVESSVPRRTIPNTPSGLAEDQVLVFHDPRPSASISLREVMNDLSSSKFGHGCLQGLKDLLCITLASSYPESLALSLGQGSAGQHPQRGDPSFQVISLDSLAAETLQSLGTGIANMCQANVTSCTLIPRLRMSEMDLMAAGKEVHSAVREKLSDFLSSHREASARKRRAKQERAETFLVDLLSDLRVSDLEEGGSLHALVGEILDNMGYPDAKYHPPPGRGGRGQPVREEGQVRVLCRCSSLFFSCHDLVPVDLPTSTETGQEDCVDMPARVRTMEDVVRAVLADVEPDEEPGSEVSLARLEGWMGRGQLHRFLPTLIKELSTLLYEQMTPRRPWGTDILDPNEQISSFALEAVNQLLPGALPLPPPPSQGVDRPWCGSSSVQQNLYQTPPDGANGGLAEPEDHGEVVDLYVNLMVGQVMENLRLSAAVSRNVLQLEKLDLRDVLHPRRPTVRGRVLRSFRRIRMSRSKESREIRRRSRAVERSEEEPCHTCSSTAS